ncbi:hypothetical protein LJB85_03930 [Porphyromonadaceae bacterium OttesenSCG-928-L07]|nr:hypothetical protein [Porphyromonadaceae bacterium OttesenSCG-928-L07]
MIFININQRISNINNLFVCGELASSGIMGANRLASNSLIECLVFGKRAVDFSINNKYDEHIPEFKPLYHVNNDYTEIYADLKKDVATLMLKNAGIIRNRQLLEEGLERINEQEQNIPQEEYEYYTLLCRNLLTVARLIIKSALYREESRGGHYREDFPQSNDKFLVHIVQQINNHITTIPVNTY